MTRPALVLAASVGWDGQRLSEQHLALALTAAGHPVVYLDPLQPSWSRGGGLATGRGAVPLSWSVSEPAPGLLRVSTAMPPGAGGRVSSGRWTAIAGPSPGRCCAAAACTPRRCCRPPPRPSVFAGYGPARRVFWAKDDYVAGATLIGLEPARIAAGQQAVARIADAVVAVSPGLQATWAGRVGEVVLIPAGADPALAVLTSAAEPAADIRLSRPMAGFVGQVSDRIDLTLLEAVAARGTSLLLVGRRQPSFGGDEQFATLTAHPHVQWIGARDYAELPSYLAALDVGLVPYTGSAFNRASFPLKLLEYLSVGVDVVATDLPAVRWLGTPRVQVATGPDDYATAVEAALASAADPARRAGCLGVAAAHGWPARATQWSEVLGLG